MGFHGSWVTKPIGEFTLIEVKEKPLPYKYIFTVFDHKPEGKFSPAFHISVWFISYIF